MRHVLANISIAQEPGGGSHRIHRLLRRRDAYAVVYWSIRTWGLLVDSRWVAVKNVYHSSADRYRLLGVGKTHSIQMRGYFAPQHQSPRREGAPLVCMVTVCGPIRLRAGFVLGGDPLGRARPRRPILFQQPSGRLGELLCVPPLAGRAGSGWLVGLQLALPCPAWPAPSVPWYLPR